MKNEKNFMGFHIPKIWQILGRFAGTFHQAPLFPEESALKAENKKILSQSDWTPVQKSEFSSLFRIRYHFLFSLTLSLNGRTSI